VGNIQGRSDKARTEPAGLEVQREGAAGGNRENLNLVTTPSLASCPLQCVDVGVADNAGQGRADVQLRPRLRVSTESASVILNGGDSFGWELLDPAAYGATRFEVDEVVARVLSLSGLSGFLATTVGLHDGTSVIATLPLRQENTSVQVGAGATVDLSTLTFTEDETASPAALNGSRIQPGCLRIQYLSGAVLRTITDNGAGALAGDVVGGTVDYATGQLAGTTSLAVDAAATVSYAFNLAAGTVRRWQLGQPGWPSSKPIVAPAKLLGGKTGFVSGASIHVARITAFGRLVF